MQAPVMAVMDDAGVIRRALQLRIVPCDIGAHRLDEGLALLVRQQHVVGRNAGLPGIQQLSCGNALGGRLDRIIRGDDGRRLAAKFEGHRSQVRCRRGHDLASDLGRAGEEKVIERQRGKARGQLRAAEDGRHAFLRKYLGQQVAQQRRGARRVFGGFQHHVVAGGDRRNQRNQGQVDRVVPRRNDADDTQRALLHLGARRPEQPVCEAVPRA